MKVGVYVLGRPIERHSTESAIRRLRALHRSHLLLDENTHLVHCDGRSLRFRTADEAESAWWSFLNAELLWP
jgi:hypothetical protein